jgi:uncharacterized protein YndB with AHSA1/START domain
MPEESGWVRLSVPPQAVFAHLANPDNLIPMLRSNATVEVYDVRPKEPGGYTYRWRYRMLGMWLVAQAETVEFEPPGVFAVRSEGAIETLSRWVLEPDGTGTRATFTISYELNNSLLARLTQSFIVNQLRYSVEVALLNIKDAEKQAAPPVVTASPPPAPRDDAPRNDRGPSIAL